MTLGLEGEKIERAEVTLKKPETLKSPQLTVINLS